MAAQDVKRKPATILAADVEGYTRLMRADEDVNQRGTLTSKQRPILTPSLARSNETAGSNPSLTAAVGSIP